MSVSLSGHFFYSAQIGLEHAFWVGTLEYTFCVVIQPLSDQADFDKFGDFIFASFVLHVTYSRHLMVT